MMGFSQRLALWVGVLALGIAATSSIVIKQMVPSGQPRLASAGERPPGEEPLLRWSEAPKVEYQYQPEIREGDDLLISVRSAALSDCDLILHPMLQDGKASPSPLIMELRNQLMGYGNIVVSGMAAGNRQMLIGGKCIWQYAKNSAEKRSVNQPDAVTVDATLISVAVLPNRTFGLTDEQLKALQIISQAIGFPAVAAALIAMYVRRRSKRAKSPHSGGVR